MKSFKVVVLYNVIAESESEAVKKLAAFHGDPLYYRVQNMVHPPEVVELDIDVQENTASKE